MIDEYREKADSLIDEGDEEVFSAMERDARRYSRAFAEEEEAELS